MTMNPFGWWKPRRGFFLNLILALVAGFAALPRLRAFADPTGLNGYFYLKQTKTIAVHHAFYFSDHSLAFLPLVLLRLITGSELLAFQLGICLALSLAFAGVIFLVAAARVGVRAAWATKAALLVALFSSSFFSEFSLSFYKNSVALALVIAAANFLVRRRYYGAGLFFLLAFLTHKSVALLGALFVVVLVAERAISLLRARAISRKELGWFAGICGACATLGILFLYHFPKAAAFASFAFRNFQGPAARITWFTELLAAKPFRALEIGAWLVLAVAALRVWPKLPRPWRWIVATVLFFTVVALHPFQPAGPASLGYRLTLMLPLLAPVLALACTFGRGRVLRGAGVGVLLLASAFNFSPLGFREKAVRREVRPYSVMLPRVMEIKEHVHPEDHLVSHHGLEFFVDYKTDIRSRSFLAAPEFSGKKYRVAYVPRKALPSPADLDALAQETLLDLGGGYVLFAEEDWEDFLAEHPVPYSWKNAIGERPAHVYE
jgi:predicted DCC family thiol-disulfide oxidoreductase YuxK